ncbi:hypothetical protein ACLUWI_09300 [Limosilactobacillus mucosae]|uniref:hypothetical protein n=1 Tax=Limosilactobacillus mucosae TaxID=97478 RepID=UPI00399282DF
MIKQSKHWLTGLLMAAMVFCLTGCVSVGAPAGNNQTADSSSSATAVSHQQAKKKHVTAKISKASESSAQTSQSSSSAAAVTSNSLDDVAASSDTTVQKAQSTTSAAQTAISQATASNDSSQAVSTVNDRVVNGLNQAASLQPENGDQYMTSQTSDGSWQVDIRTSSGEGQDPNVSHLKGIYKYNPETGEYQQMDPMTGEFN